MMDAIDRLFLERAVALAERGMFSVTANPRVGCIIVKDGRVLGRGAHLRAGEGHAEVNAIADARSEVRGATVYVSLEPCSYTGRTPACTSALINAGVKRVVGAMADPNPQVAGVGYDLLEQSGMQVERVELASAARLNYGHLCRMRTGLPYVRIKIAQSLDGRTAMASGESKWITSAAARADVQYWRARSGAVVTGIGTVAADDPALNVRDLRFALPMETTAAETQPQFRQPLRVVVDSSLRIGADSQILNDSSATLVAHARAGVARAGVARAGVARATTAKVDPAAAKLINSGVEVCDCSGTSTGSTSAPETGRVDLHLLLRKLGELGCNEVLIEAGPTLVGAFLSAGLWDELLVYTAPKFLGSNAQPTALLPLHNMSEAIEAKIAAVDLLGADMRTRLVRPDTDLAKLDVVPLGYPE